MIHAKDWIIFLKHGIALEELPIPPEHMKFCKNWPHRKAQKESVKKSRPSLEDLVRKIEANGGYPSKKYNRAELSLDFGIHYETDKAHK